VLDISPVCERLLATVMPEIVATLDATLFRAVALATRQRVSGAAGSCLPEFMSPQVGNGSIPVIRTPAGQTLEDVLSTAVTRIRGGVWIALENDGLCSFGVVTPAEGGGLCLMPIGHPGR
jgi:hypothetical protein